jgi:hypothetical protein
MLWWMSQFENKLVKDFISHLLFILIFNPIEKTFQNLHSNCKINNKNASSEERESLTFYMLILMKKNKHLMNEKLIDCNRYYSLIKICEKKTTRNVQWFEEFMENKFPKNKS